jgi:hypothetical protein
MVVCAAVWKVRKCKNRKFETNMKVALKALSKATQKAYNMDREDLLGGS